MGKLCMKNKYWIFDEDWRKPVTIDKNGNILNWFYGELKVRIGKYRFITLKK